VFPSATTPSYVIIQHSIIKY